MKFCVVLVPVNSGTTTFTVIVHAPPLPMVPPVRVTESAPVDTVPLAKSVPVQVTLALAGEATFMPAGKVSVKLSKGIVAVAFGFVSTMVSAVARPT